MRLNILSRSISVPSTRRLVEVARARGHKVRVLNPLHLEMFLDRKGPRLFYRTKPLAPCDVVIPRLAHSSSHFGLSVVNQFELQGALLVNSAQAIAQARNPMRCLQLLSQHGIDIPATVMAKDATEATRMVSLLGGVPVVLRLVQGHERQGLMVCESLQSMEAALQAVLGLGQNLIVQQYVRSGGRDIRVLVVGGKAVAGVRRSPRVGRLSKSLFKGARLEPVKLTAEQRDVAVRAAKLVELEVAAVDLLEHKGRSRVFEVNGSPAIAEMERATGVDLATPIIEHAEFLLNRR